MIDMKINSILLAILVGSFFMLIIPFLLIYLNARINLPVFSNLFFTIVGLFLIFIGTAVFLYCSGLFIKIGKGTPAPIEPPKKLVIKGLYKFTRNPIYLGYMSIFFGEFFIFGQFLLLVYFILSISLIHFYVVCREEPLLKRRFGKDYIEYMKRVPRWFPKKFF
ncbi:MAG: isoprenylcysteine carboxylmethyltransferase family protein [Candidatus Aenigmarchaeota archaeon]|nr:isoprenylcysteine carboxylmethyltransferase family protein [Candidatus Aenigmarchaeota archaeon]